MNYRESSRVNIEAQVRELSGSDVLRKVGKKIYDAIKARDSHPMFIELEVAEEGVSTGELEIYPGVFENVKKWWPAKIVRELAGMLKPLGKKVAKLFTGHTSYDDPEGRTAQSYGHVVHSETTQRDGKEVLKAIAYVESGDIREDILSKKYDTCSIQSRVNFLHNGTKWLAQKVMSVSGLALADSRISKPGFANASIGAVVRELESNRVREIEDENEDEDEEEDDQRGHPVKKKRSTKRKAGNMDIDEIRLQISKNAVPPERLYGAEELGRFPIIKGMIDNAKEEGRGEGEAERDEMKADLESKIADLESKTGEKDKELESLKTELKPHHEQKIREGLAETIRASDALKDSPEKEASFIVDRVPVAVMEESDPEKRGRLIEEAIGKAKEDITRYGMKFEEGEPSGGGSDENEEGRPGRRNESSTIPLGENNPLSQGFDDNKKEGR